MPSVSPARSASQRDRRALEDVDAAGQRLAGLVVAVGERGLRRLGGEREAAVAGVGEDVGAVTGQRGLDPDPCAELAAQPARPARRAAVIEALTLADVAVRRGAPVHAPPGHSASVAHAAPSALPPAQKPSQPLPHTAAPAAPQCVAHCAAQSAEPLHAPMSWSASMRASCEGPPSHASVPAAQPATGETHAQNPPAVSTGAIVSDPARARRRTGGDPASRT